MVLTKTKAASEKLLLSTTTTTTTTTATSIQDDQKIGSSFLSLLVGTFGGSGVSCLCIEFR